MAPNKKQKYIDYAIDAIHCLRRENGLTITNIVHHIKIMTEETLRFRPLFDKVRAATDHGISTGVLTRHRNRIQLRSDNYAMSSGDESDTSDEDSVSEDDASSVATTDNEAGSSSDDSEQQERRKPVKRVNKKQQKLRTRAGVKRHLVDASSDEETDSDEGNIRIKKRKIDQRKSRRNGTPKHRPEKRDLPLREKSSPVKPKRGGGRLKVSEVDKDVALVIPKFVKVKVEVEEVDEDSDGATSMECLPLSTLALDAGKRGNRVGKCNASVGAQERGSGVGGEWSGSHRTIREEVNERRLLVPAESGTRGERLRMREAKTEKAEEGTKKQDGDRNEACGSAVKVKVEKVY